MQGPPDGEPGDATTGDQHPAGLLRVHTAARPSYPWAGAGLTALPGLGSRIDAGSRSAASPRLS
ncbi:two-component sensor histidine kinase [Methylorubrum populi]|uniref:Two-component sensor histidine kinase n=1 Tax=Methylorubrum populi TaxID=223967 RepID=A0A160PDB2_9HYPH|nr:two-component sensor histidine kinase [Methylorubrum populi]